MKHDKQFLSSPRHLCSKQASLCKTLGCDYNLITTFVYVLDSAHVKFDVSNENNLLQIHSTAKANASIVTD